MVSFSGENFLKEPWNDNRLIQENSKNESIRKINFYDFFQTPLKNTLLYGLKLYQSAISPVIGSRCSMYPSCSHYSILAIRKHGGLIGFTMSVDRLMHEAEELQSGPIIENNGRYLIFDPVENNDFWWSKK